MNNGSVNKKRLVIRLVLLALLVVVQSQKNTVVQLQPVPFGIYPAVLLVTFATTARDGNGAVTTLKKCHCVKLTLDNHKVT